MIFNHYLPHISSKSMFETRVLSIFSKGNVRINKKNTNYNEKYEIVLMGGGFLSLALAGNFFPSQIKPYLSTLNLKYINVL